MIMSAACPCGEPSEGCDKALINPRDADFHLAISADRNLAVDIRPGQQEGIPSPDTRRTKE
jgi:hypothetical protein